MNIWFFAVPVVFLVACILLWKLSARTRHFFRKLLVRFETKDFRPWAEQRDWFLKLTLAFFLAGLFGAVCKSELLKPHFAQWFLSAAGIVFDVSALLMAVVGFFFAVYGIRGVLERPRDLEEILVRAAQLIDRYDKDGFTAVMLSEYPAWGALSLKEVPAYQDFVNSFSRFLRDGLKTKVILVGPDDTEMDNRIHHYALDYDRNATQESDAKNANKEVLKLFDRVSTQHRFTRHQKATNDVPRYQALIIGKEIPDDKTPGNTDLLPVEAIVWYAPRNSDVTTGLAGQTHAAKRQAWDWTENEVPVLAWQTTAPYILRELYDCTLFYANRDKRPTYQEFLTEVDPIL
jgi:hypothetical protein